MAIHIISAKERTEQISQQMQVCESKEKNGISSLIQPLLDPSWSKQSLEYFLQACMYTHIHIYIIYICAYVYIDRYRQTDMHMYTMLYLLQFQAY